jgi:RNA polymerase sigma-70 factor (ECF subfamily)
MSESPSTCLELVRQAQAGDPEGKAALIGLVRERVYPFINRTLLDRDKSEDLTQDTILAVLESFSNLKDPKRFWSWVFTIATSQIRQHFRRRSRSGVVQMLDIAKLYPLKSFWEDDSSALASRKELGELTRTAMSQIGIQHRMVLALRFFEDMPHAEIARILGCTELGARMRFFNAKRALVRQLKRLGVNKNTFLASLAAFGTLTLGPSAKTASAAVSVSAATESALAGLACSKASVAAALALLVAVSGLASLAIRNREKAPTRIPAAMAPTIATGSNLAGPETKYVHFGTRRIAPNQTARPDTYFYKHWYLMPDGPDGCVLWRMDFMDPQQNTLRGFIIQNADAQYVVSYRNRTVYLRDYGVHAGFCTHSPLPPLPMAPPKLSEFAALVEGEQSVAMASKPGVLSGGIAFQRDPRTGWITGHEDTSGDKQIEKVSYDYSPFDLQLLEFQPPTDMRIVDQRSENGKRGWVCATIRGELRGQPVTGVWRIPFTFRTAGTHEPFMRVDVGDDLTFVDAPTGAFLVDRARGISRRFERGSFFAGLPRPWQGYTAADTVRRDAARNQIWYSPIVEKKDAGQVEFCLVQDHRPGGSPLMARYRINKDAGTVEQVTFWEARGEAFDQPIGHLSFTYSGDDEAIQAAMAQIPALDAESSRTISSTSVFWPIVLPDQSEEPPSRAVASMNSAGPDSH